MCGKKKKAPSNFSINPRPTVCLNNTSMAAYLPKGKEKKAMKLPRSTVVWCVLIVCLTLLIFTFLTRKSLCEIRLKDGKREVAAVLAYESGK